MIWYWIVPLIIIAVLVIIFVVNQVVSAHLRQAATGKEELYGKKALVKTPLNPEGKVLYDGEIWAARIENGSAEVGQEVVIVRLEGLKLYVKMERSE
ncbi:MAG: NfeD family protein [Dehalococcoides mccartyi]|uniref:NfeD family protein n=1 Tax=Dehalococcoides TaxID=61434 RepID=UPI0019FF7D97|nr:NfeD family protein [Dehalococcoides mccartyi]MBF4482948.1 NfeD family protein [Dehalococcoides mccartyi]MBJ7532052.1 NfeD family protein [Dehalococcoides mccartyi]MDP4280245.1 NfeD family protein [Dehalococcoides mccartyi]